MNQINPNNYWNALKPMRPRLKHTVQELGQDALDQCSREAVATHIPIITVLLFALREDVLGELDVLRQCLNRRLKDASFPEIEVWNE